MMNPVVAIVGRANVGKSRLFNRIASKKKAIVLDLPGTTRDTIYETVEWERVTFDIVDTGGLSDDRSSIHFRINKRVKSVVDEASAIIMLCDYKTGVVPYDFEIANWLRKTNKQVFLAVNKVDKPDDPSALSDFYQLGFKDVFAISAEHGYGVDTILDATTQYLKSLKKIQQQPEKDVITPLKLVFTGKPNVGKSSMVNYIIGNELMIVDDKPGTTRDPVELRVEINKTPMILIDTAGIKKKKDSQLVEKLSVMKAKDAIQKADIVVVVVDISQGITGIDKKIINMVQSYGKGCVIALNKWDTIGKQHRHPLLNTISNTLHFVDYIPFIPTSAITGEGIHDLMNEVIKVSYNYDYRIPTSDLNKFLRKVLNEYQPISNSGKIIRPQYIVQVATRPPMFVIFTNTKAIVKENYAKFMIKRIRDIFGFKGVPIKLSFRRKD